MLRVCLNCFSVARRFSCMTAVRFCDAVLSLGHGQVPSTDARLLAVSSPCLLRSQSLSVDLATTL